MEKANVKYLKLTYNELPNDIEVAMERHGLEEHEIMSSLGIAMMDYAEKKHMSINTFKQLMLGTVAFYQARIDDSTDNQTESKSKNGETASAATDALMASLLMGMLFGDN